MMDLLFLLINSGLIMRPGEYKPVRQGRVTCLNQEGTEHNEYTTGSSS
jgi:hypothetical protein